MQQTKKPKTWTAQPCRTRATSTHIAVQMSCKPAAHRGKIQGSLAFYTPLPAGRGKGGVGRGTKSATLSPSYRIDKTRSTGNSEYSYHLQSTA